MRVEIYWNLHKRLFSVRALEGEHKGRVIAHSYGICLVRAKFVVQPAGRERVRRENKKNVHAFVRGQIVDRAWAVVGFSRRCPSRRPVNITYNPYMHDSFVNFDTKSPVYKSDLVWMDVMLDKENSYPRIRALDNRQIKEL